MVIEEQKQDLHPESSTLAFPSAKDSIGKHAALAEIDCPSIPGYEILAELGRGGMGVVFKARQQESNRLVALKMIRDAALAGPRERGRFRIEAEAIARARHPNIIEIYAVCEHAGCPYYAMELLEGGSLAKLL